MKTGVAQAERTRKFRKALAPYISGSGKLYRATRDVVAIDSGRTEKEEASATRGIPSLDLGRAVAREAAVRPVLEGWCVALRRDLFETEKPPFADVEAAREAYATTLDQPDGLGEMLDDLRARHREIEDEYSLTLRDPTPVAEALEFPAENGSGVSRRRDVRNKVHVVDADSDAYRLACSIRQTANWSGYRRADLTAFVLAGVEPRLPAVTVEVRTEVAPSDAPGERLRPERHAAVRLNEPPTVKKMRDVLGELREIWADRYAAERAALVELVTEIVPEKDLAREPLPATPEVWQPVTDIWNRGRDAADQISWRAVRLKYRTAAEKGEV